MLFLCLSLLEMNFDPLLEVIFALMYFELGHQRRSLFETTSGAIWHFGEASDDPLSDSFKWKVNSWHGYQSLVGQENPFGPEVARICFSRFV
jgi:hypothetical protein